MIEILKLSTVTNPERESIIEQIKFIFYASSSLKEFSSEERKAAFFKRWCGDYITLFPEQFYIARENLSVMGYLSGCQNSEKAMALLEVPGFSVFSDLFESYPAHFHINFHPDCRGRGLGSGLLTSYCDDLKRDHIQGVHLVTSPGAANISFYQRLKFNHEVQREFNQMALLFMAKLLD